MLRHRFDGAAWQGLGTDKLDQKRRLAGLSPDLPAGHGVQGEVGGPPGQRFRYLAEQRQIRRTGEHEAARTPLFIHAAFQGKQQFGAALHLVEDGVLGQQSLGISLGGSQRGEIVQRSIDPILAQFRLLQQQGALARLTQSRQHDDRQMP